MEAPILSKKETFTYAAIGASLTMILNATPINWDPLYSCHRDASRVVAQVDNRDSSIKLPHPESYDTLGVVYMQCVNDRLLRELPPNIQEKFREAYQANKGQSQEIYQNKNHKL